MIENIDNNDLDFYYDEEFSYSDKIDRFENNYFDYYWNPIFIIVHGKIIITITMAFMDLVGLIYIMAGDFQGWGHYGWMGISKLLWMGISNYYGWGYQATMDGDIQTTMDGDTPITMDGDIILMPITIYIIYNNNYVIITTILIFIMDIECYKY